MKKHTLSDGLFVLEPELYINSYSTIQVNIWFLPAGWNFPGKVRTSLKLWSITMNCLQYAVWHITNNSSGALDGAQPKESMNRPWLFIHSTMASGTGPAGFSPTPNKCMNASLLAGLYLSCMSQSSLFLFFFYKPLCNSKAMFKSAQMLNASIFSLWDRSSKIGKWMQKMKNLTSFRYPPE